MHEHLAGISYRATCTTGTHRQLGGCGTSPTNSGSGLFRAYVNETRVDDYTDTVASGIAPYGRPKEIYPSCAGGSPDCVTSGNPLCGQWIMTGTPDFWFPCSNAVDYNCYKQTTGLTDVRTCNKIGFKNVQAHKSWHGIFPYTAPEWNYIDVMGEIPTDPSPNPCQCTYQSQQLTPTQTKYCTIAITSTYDRHVIDDGLTHSASSTRQFSVGKTNGIQTVDSCADTFNDAIGSGELPLSISNVGIAFTNLTVLYSAFCAEVLAFGGFTFAYDGGGGAWHGIYDDGANVTEITVDVDAGTFDKTVTHTSAGYITAEQHYAITDTTLHWESISRLLPPDTPRGSESYVLTSVVDATLSNPYNAGDVIEQINALLARWDLTNDSVYPWRTDEFTTVAPLVTYNERGPTSISNLDCDFVDPESLIYDGSIRGAPLPLGYAHHFDWRHVTWDTCLDDFGGRAWYERLYGAYAAESEMGDPTDAVVPLGASQWTDNYNAGNYAPWGWIHHELGTVTAQKWAEIKVRRPSFNFARPCGQDRYNFEEATVRCVTGYNTSTPSVTVDIVREGAPAIATNDAVLVCGSDTGINGGWTVTKVSDTQYTLAARLFSFPSGFTAPYDCEGGIFGKLRFPNAPGVCGKVQVSNATITAPITLGLHEATWLRDGDKVFVEGVQGNTAANGYWTVAVRDAQTIVLSGSNSGNAPYIRGGTVRSANAADESWNDTEVKGEYVYLTWENDYRDYQEAARISGFSVANPDCSGCVTIPPAVRPYLSTSLGQQTTNFTCATDCLPYKPCTPAVICISPNGEEFINGHTYDFGDITLDEQYTAHWASQVKQHATDPLWQAPHKLCADEDTNGHPQFTNYQEDDGSCLSDDDGADPPLRYYPLEPFVEARCSIPDGAPLLPQGVYFGCLTYAQLNQASPPSGNACVMPNPVDHAYPSAAPNQRAMPWGYYLRELSCVCGDVRPDFVDDYQANGVDCASEVPAP